MQDSGGGRVKSRHVTTGKGRGGEVPLSGTFLAWTKKRAKKSTPVGLFLRGQGREFREEMQRMGGWGVDG